MADKFAKILNLLKAHDVDSYLVRKKMKAAQKIARDAEGEKEDNGWRTTENGKHYQINSKGEVVKGPNAMVGGNVNKPETWNKSGSGSTGTATKTSGSKAKAAKPTKSPREKLIEAKNPTQVRKALEEHLNAIPKDTTIAVKNPRTGKVDYYTRNEFGWASAPSRVGGMGSSEFNLMLRKNGVGAGTDLDEVIRPMKREPTMEGLERNNPFKVQSNIAPKTGSSVPSSENQKAINSLLEEMDREVKKAPTEAIARQTQKNYEKVIQSLQNGEIQMSASAPKADLTKTEEFHDATQSSNRMMELGTKLASTSDPKEQEAIRKQMEAEQVKNKEAWEKTSKVAGNSSSVESPSFKKESYEDFEKRIDADKTKPIGSCDNPEDIKNAPVGSTVSYYNPEAGGEEIWTKQADGMWKTNNPDEDGGNLVPAMELSGMNFEGLEIYPPKGESKSSGNKSNLPESVRTAINYTSNVPQTGYPKDKNATEESNSRINNAKTDAEKVRALRHEMINAPDFTAVTTGEDEVYVKQNGKWVEFTGGNPGDKEFTASELALQVEFAEDLPTVIHIPTTGTKAKSHPSTSSISSAKQHLDEVFGQPTKEFESNPDFYYTVEMNEAEMVAKEARRKYEKMRKTYDEYESAFDPVNGGNPEKVQAAQEKMDKVFGKPTEEDLEKYGDAWYDLQMQEARMNANETRSKYEKMKKTYGEYEEAEFQASRTSKKATNNPPTPDDFDNYEDFLYAKGSYEDRNGQTPRFEADPSWDDPAPNEPDFEPDDDYDAFWQNNIPGEYGTKKKEHPASAKKSPVEKERDDKVKLYNKIQKLEKAHQAYNDWQTKHAGDFTRTNPHLNSQRRYEDLVREWEGKYGHGIIL